ncbi:MAG: S8 family serine peptidase, partial [Phycisphaerales bacterium]|nr:S8 family serine peptidase [Phycisphaerales bacterium]
RAMLLDQRYYPTYEDPDGMLQLMRDSLQNGAVLSSNSWGPSPVPLGYDLDTRLVDIGVRDADSELYGNQPLGFVLSIMNGSGGSQTQGTPDEALNIVSVGATQFRTAGGSLPNSHDDIASVSAHGPCLDGRLLPDLVAPGCYVLSTYDPVNWAYSCGTSMAAPQVAGAIGLFVQHYKEAISIGRDPSPAMAKAAVLVAAKDLYGNDDADGWSLGHVPDSKQGWGRLQLPELINPEPGSMRYVDQTVVFGETGEAWTVNVTPADPSKPMRVMLVWTTAAGHGLGGTTPAWSNDLDLVVESNGQSYVGNAFHPTTGWSVAGGDRDAMNNAEGVFLGPSAPAAATIRVEAAAIVADGIPSYGDATDQDFALVCWNCEADPFTVELDPPWQDGCAPSTIMATVEVNETGGGSLPVTLEVSGDPGIEFKLADAVVVPPATTNLMITVPFGAEGVYNFAVIGTSSSFEQTANGQVVVEQDSPVPPELLEPQDGDGHVSTLPTLTWAEVSGASSYSVELSEDAGFADVFYAATESGVSHTVLRHLAFGSTFYWRVRSLNACGEGSWSPASTFTTAEGVVVLFVDDDDDTPDVSGMYTEILDSLGVTYDVWNTNNSDFEPDFMTLSEYDLVIWASGHEWGGGAGPGEAGEAALATWLDSGGTLLLSSQDYLYDHGLTAFGSDYLGVGSYDSDVEQPGIVGVSPPFDVIPSMTLSYPFSDYSDKLEPSGVADVAIEGTNGTAGVMIDQGTWRTAFLAFPVEAIEDVEQRRQLLSVMINWVPQPIECPADITGDGTVDVQDLLVVLSDWGGSGSADITGDGIVDVMDLLGVVAEWGSCP